MLKSQTMQKLLLCLRDTMKDTRYNFTLNRNRKLKGV